MVFIKNILIRLLNRYVGQDKKGNCYYKSLSKNYLSKKKRLVIFNGSEEPSKIPCEWYAWLHHLSDEVPSEVKKSTTCKWYTDRKENMTGTKLAYSPLKKKVRKKVSSDYLAWVPKEVRIDES